MPRRRRTGPWVALVAALVLGAAAVLALWDARADEAPPGALGSGAVVGLPESVSGLPARSGGVAADAADRLEQRLREDAAVSDVAIGLYGAGDENLLVVLVTPVEPLSERTAGELTARLIGAAGPERGMADDIRSTPSADGHALITCSTPAEGTSTCVTVEPDMALVVLTSGLRDLAEQDPLAMTEAVRDTVRASG